MPDDPMITLCEETIRMLSDFMGMHGVHFGRLAHSVRGAKAAKARMPIDNGVVNMIIKTSPTSWPVVEVSFYKKGERYVGRARVMLGAEKKFIDITNGFDEVLEAWNDVRQKWIGE